MSTLLPWIISILHPQGPINSSHNTASQVDSVQPVSAATLAPREADRLAKHIPSQSQLPLEPTCPCCGFLTWARLSATPHLRAAPVSRIPEMTQFITAPTPPNYRRKQFQLIKRLISSPDWATTFPDSTHRPEEALRQTSRCYFHFCSH